MKVFISWSGPASKVIARALYDWIPGVINAVEPFMSDDSIEAGQRWQTEVATQLDKTDFGLVCVTPENQESPWLNFEAGALAKQLVEARVVPVVHGLELGDVRPPLGQFNGVRLDHEGVTKMMRSIHEAAGAPLKGDRFERSMAKWWPDLEEAIAGTPSTVAPAKPVREDREILLEILEGVRAISREPSRHAFGTAQSERDQHWLLLDYLAQQRHTSGEPTSLALARWLISSEKAVAAVDREENRLKGLWDSPMPDDPILPGFTRHEHTPDEQPNEEPDGTPKEEPDERPKRDQV